MIVSRAAIARTLRMFLVLAGTVLAMPTLAQSLAPVELRYLGKLVSVRTQALSDKREVFVPLEVLSTFGATHTLTKREETAIIIFGDKRAVEVALTRLRGQPMAPLTSLLPHMRAEMTLKDGLCEIVEPKKSAPPAPRPADTAKPAPMKETQKQTEAPKTPSPEQKAPVTQRPDSLDTEKPKPQTKPDQKAPAKPEVKVPVQTVEKPPVKQDKNDKPTRETVLDLHLPSSKSLQAHKAGVQSADPMDPTKPAMPTQVPVVSKSAIKVQEVFFEAIDDNHGRVRIKTAGGILAPNVKLLRDPSRIAIELPNTSLELAERDWAIDHPFLTSVHLEEGEKPGAASRVVLELGKLVTFRVLAPTKDGVQVNLGLPRGVGRRISDLIIVVDAGHGGKSTGCSAIVNGQRIYEKQLTLLVAKKLQKILTDAGANVIMTRTDDRDLGLSERPQVANDNNADMFVSIHVDDCRIPNTASGTSAYFHMQDESSRALAQSIVGHIARVSGLPCRGAITDRARFNTGMAVLRYSTVPATLVEMAYINNARDRAKLLDDAFQQTVAMGIFNGIKGYFEGSLPDTETGGREATRIMNR